MSDAKLDFELREGEELIGFHPVMTEDLRVGQVVVHGAHVAVVIWIQDNDDRLTLGMRYRGGSTTEEVVMKVSTEIYVSTRLLFSTFVCAVDRETGRIWQEWYGRSLK
jgi:hypothetical protein